MAHGFKNKAKAVWAFIVQYAKKVFEYLKVAKMEWIIMISVFAADLIAKSLVENFLDFNETVPIIPYFLNAHKVHNYAAVFGSDWLRSWMGAIGARIFFCVFAVAASVVFILVLIRNKGKSRVFRIAAALFVAGAMGNCIDRMVLGYVRDFIEFEYFGLTIFGRKTWSYIFNIADVALVTGVLLIVFYFLFLYRDNDKKKVQIAIDAEPEYELSDAIGQADAQQEQNVEQADGHDGGDVDKNEANADKNADESVDQSANDGADAGDGEAKDIIAEQNVGGDGNIE